MNHTFGIKYLTKVCVQIIYRLSKTIMLSKDDETYGIYFFFNNFILFFYLPILLSYFILKKKLKCLFLK